MDYFLKKPKEDLIEEDNCVNLRKYILVLRKILNDVRIREKKKMISIQDLHSKLSLNTKKIFVSYNSIEVSKKVQSKLGNSAHK